MEKSNRAAEELQDDEIPQADEAVEAAKKPRVWIVLANYALIAL